MSELAPNILDNIRKYCITYMAYSSSSGWAFNDCELVVLPPLGIVDAKKSIIDSFTDDKKPEKIVIMNVIPLDGKIVTWDKSS